MRVERRNVIDADRDAVWKIVSDPDRYPSFMTNLERWESANDQPPGVGARYLVHWKIGSVPVGGLIEVVEFDDLRDLAWVGITGVNHARPDPVARRAGGPDQGDVPAVVSGSGRDLGLHRRPGRRGSGGSHRGRHPQATQATVEPAAEQASATNGFGIDQVSLVLQLMAVIDCRCIHFTERLIVEGKR